MLIEMSGKVMKKLRRQAYGDRSTNSEGRQYGLVKHEKRIVVPAKTEGEDDRILMKKTGTLVCTDDRTYYQDLKKMRRNKTR